MALANYLEVSTGSLTASTINAITISSGTTYARTLSSANVYADYFYGDGSRLSNISFSPQAYSIPWNAMSETGNLTVKSGDWHLQTLTVSTLNISSSAVTSQIISQKAIFGSIQVPVISSFYISTNAIATESISFNIQGGRLQTIESSLTRYLSTGTLQAGATSVESVRAYQGIFSSISTGSWEVGTLNLSSLTLYDYTLNTPVTLAINNGKIFLNEGDLLFSTVSSGQLVSTTAGLLYQLYLTSNAIDIRQAYSTLLSNTFNILSVTQSSVSSLSTTIGLSSNFAADTTSNLSVAISMNFGSLCNYTTNFISNVSTNDSLTTLSTFSTSYYIMESGFSSLSTAMVIRDSINARNFSSLYIQVSTISSGTMLIGGLTSDNITINLAYISTLSTIFTNFQQMRGSTMSSLTQQTGILNANQLTTSSFSGNYADAFTAVIQYA